MSWFNDAHVVRGLLGAGTALAAAVFIGFTQLPQVGAEPSQRVTPSAPAFRPLETRATVAAAAPMGAFEEPYAPSRAAAAEKKREAMDVPTLDIARLIKDEVPFETGIASTYGLGDGFQGNRTACGQIFDTHVVQVAHRTLECGTLIRIEDSETRKSVVAKVTDRGPYIRGRIVDLSWAAFRQLEPAGGLRRVNVYLVD